MSEADALSKFEFPKGKGLFVTFSDGDEYKVRVLTTDPVVSTSEYENAKTGEVTVSTKFAFIVYNFTLSRAQILNAGATITKEIQRLHQDEEWGANIKKMDIKISAEGEQLGRKYTITPVPKPETLTMDQIKECRAINLEEKIENGQRMSLYDPNQVPTTTVEEPVKDKVVEDEDEEEPINLDDIPF